MNKVLSQNNVELAVWLCQQLDMGILTQEPLPISQAVLLSLLQQLGYDLTKVGIWLLLVALPCLKIWLCLAELLLMQQEGTPAAVPWAQTPFLTAGIQQGRAQRAEVRAQH